MRKIKLTIWLWLMLTVFSGAVLQAQAASLTINERIKTIEACAAEEAIAQTEVERTAEDHQDSNEEVSIEDNCEFAEEAAVEDLFESVEDLLTEDISETEEVSFTETEAAAFGENELYTIYFYSDDTKVNVVSMADCRVDTPYALPENTFTKTGYVFSGWKRLIDDTWSVYQPGDQVGVSSENYVPELVYYAEWEAQAYTITYQLGGGTNSSLNPSSYTIESEDILLAAPTRTGYTFAGWYKDSSKKIPADTIVSGSTGKKIFYAKWTENTYSIRFRWNGGDTGSMSSVSNCLYSKSYTLPASTYSRTGYTFAGWNTKEDGSGTKITDGAVVQSLTSKNGGAVYLYAQWKANKYYVAYYGNNGTGTMSKQACYYDTASNLKANAFTLTNMSFVSWNTKADGSGYTYTNKQSILNLTSTSGKVIKLYAQWRLTTTPTITEIARGRLTTVNKLTYKKVAGREKYVIYRSTVKDGTYKKIGETTSTSYKDTTAVPGTKYYYKVKAVGYNGSYKVYSNESAVKSVETAYVLDLEADIVTKGNAGSVSYVKMSITNKGKAKVIVNGAFGTYYKENGSTEIGSIWKTAHIFDKNNYVTEIAGENVGINAGYTKTFYISMVNKTPMWSSGKMEFWITYSGFTYRVTVTHTGSVKIE